MIWLIGALTFIIWLVLWLRHGGFWRTTISPLPGLPRDWPGVVVEEKGLSVGIHYRAAPDAEAAVHEAVESLTPSQDLVAQWGQTGQIEIATPWARATPGHAENGAAYLTIVSPTA